MTAPAGSSTGELFLRTVAALESTGRRVRTDPDLQTVDLPAPGLAEPTLGVVLPGSDAVVFYSVWPDAVPEAARPAVGRFVLLANTGLSTSALEFDADAGILSARCGLGLGTLAAGTGDHVDLSARAFGGLLVACVDEVERVRATHEAAVAAVTAGDDPAAAFAEVRADAR